MQGRFDALADRISAGYAQTSEAEGLTEIDGLLAIERNRTDSSPPARIARTTRTNRKGC